VVVLTVSKDEEDILKSYDLYANCYVTKPINMEQFIAVVRSIEDFWLTIVKLPHDFKRWVIILYGYCWSKTWKTLNVYSGCSSGLTRTARKWHRVATCKEIVERNGGRLGRV
jgi:hypothetical protein